MSLPLDVKLREDEVSREVFFGWVWEEYGSRGLLGVHEGTLLCEEAAEQGLETESWTVDAAEAPRERDWMHNQELSEAEFFFASMEQAEEARQELLEITGIQAGPIVQQLEEDWNATWRASFNQLENGFVIPPFWKIYPSWIERDKLPREEGIQILRINPGAGFGTGTHETTQLCLQAIGDLSKRKKFARALDFGSGSGILAIGCALLDAEVCGVEIDSLAIDNALDNAALNGVESNISFTKTLDDVGSDFPLVIANILRPVLVQFAPELVRRIARGGTLILSGLIESDVPEVDRVYSALLGRKPELRALNEWRLLWWCPTFCCGSRVF
jgi:ribosomal protein L11 methyltransferase